MIRPSVADTITCLRTPGLSASAAPTGATVTTPRSICDETATELVPNDGGSQRLATSTRVFELAFPYDALERLVRILDAVLIIGPVRGKQLHDLVGAVGGHVPNWAGREVHRLTDLKLVLFQRDSPELERHTPPPFERCSPRSGRNIAAKSTIASKIPLLLRDQFQSPTEIE